MINFSSVAGNDMVASDAAALGVSAFQNVRTGSTTAGATVAISLDSVTGGVSYADYYQRDQKGLLGQPYATFVGAKKITDSGIVALAGSNSSAYITLNLGAWMTAGGWTRYKVTVYYAGRSAAAEDLMTDATPDVSFFDGVTTTPDIMTVDHRGSAQFAGIGEPHLFTSDTLTINMNYLGGTSEPFQAGICAIKIEDGTNPDPDTLLWTGAKNGEWSNGTLGDPSNWVLASDATTPSDFLNKDNVLFDDSQTNFTTTAIDISKGDVKPASVIFRNDDNDLILTGAQGIAGTGSVSIEGFRALRIENANTLTGTVTHTSGDVTIANENAFQNATLDVLADTLALETITALNLGGLSGYGNIALENVAHAPLVLTLGNGDGSGAYDGELSGAGSIVKTGSGSQTFSYTNTYSGGTTVLAGPAQNDASNTPAALQVGFDGALGEGQVAFTNTTSTSLIKVTGSAELANDISLSSSAGIVNEITVDNFQTATLSGKISGGDATSLLHLDSSASAAASMLKLTNPANDFTVSTIRMWRGGLGIASDGALGNPDNDIELFTESVNGPLQFDADDITLNAGRSIIFYTNTASAPINTQEFTATIAGDFSGVGTLVKLGTGKLILTGINNATGRSLVSAGTMQVDGSFSSGGDIVTASEFGTLSGNGTIDRAVSIDGTLSPGASVGTLTIGGPLTLGAASKYNWEAGDWSGPAGAGYDTTVADSLVISATNANPVTIVVTPDTITNFANESANFTLITTTGGITGFASDAFIVDASALPQATGTWKVEQNGDDLKLAFAYSAMTPFQSWAQTHISGIAPGAPAGFDQDADADGISNGLEWILGGDPLAQDAATLVSTAGTAAGGLTLTFTREESTLGQAVLTVEWDTDLSDGFANSIPIVNGSPGVTIDTATTPDAVTVNIPAASAPAGRIFARLRAELP